MMCVPVRLGVDAWTSSEVTSLMELSGYWLWEIGAPWLEHDILLEL